MDTQEFVKQYREEFGQNAALPLMFYYSDTRLAETEKIQGCFLKYLRLAMDGKPVSLSAEEITCGGGKFYAGFAPMPPHVPVFVSSKERYKESEGLVMDYLGAMGPVPAEKKYLNFVRVDQAASFSRMEGLLFIAEPDIISGLCAWAFYDRNEPDTVSLVFGSGCFSTVTNAVRENRNGGYRCYVGLTDPSARQWFRSGVLSFVIPACRFTAMSETMDRCCLNDTAGWNRIRSRIESEGMHAMETCPAAHVHGHIPAWADEMNCAITVCDSEGVILYMNGKSRQTYRKHGDLIGKNLLECHSDRSRAIIRDLLRTGGQNVYTIEKEGVRKMIYQSAWKEEGKVMGLCEISIVLPEEIPHHVRG